MRARIVGLKRYKDRHGRERLYWQRAGAPSIALDPALKGASLVAEVAKLEKKYLTKEPAQEGSLRSLVIAYRTTSNHWRSLRARTRKDYERVFTWLGAALDMKAADILPHDMALARDKARDQHEPKFANQVITTLKMVYRHGVEYGLVAHNPCLNLSKAVGGNRRENRACKPWEAVALLDHAPAPLRPAIALAIYTGIREGDIVALSRATINGDWIELAQSKTRRPHAAYITRSLRSILAAIPAHNATTLLVSSKGAPWTLEGLKTSWSRYRDDMEARGLIGPGVRFHGLRHTGATILEENGYEESQTRHFLGHGPKTVSGHYAKSAKRMALVTEMALTIERVLSEARGNVVALRQTHENGA